MVWSFFFFIGWVGRSVLYCHHSKVYQNQGCASEQQSHRVCQCGVRFSDLSVNLLTDIRVGLPYFTSIEQDPDIPIPPPSPIHGFSDRRRVKMLNQVVTNERVSFNIF